jgi:hypothetical protein
VEVVVPRAGTGGITIFATSTPLGGFGSAFLIRRLEPEGFLAEDFLATAFLAEDFLAGRFAPDLRATDFLAPDLRATDFRAALFFAGRADFFLVATLAPSTLEVSLTSPTESLLAGVREARHLAAI